jgi:hypothetical protein
MKISRDYPFNPMALIFIISKFILFYTFPFLERQPADQNLIANSTPNQLTENGDLKKLFGLENSWTLHPIN